MCKEIILLTLLVTIVINGNSKMDLEEKSADAFKEWYETYWPQKDNQKAAKLLASSLMECRVNKENKQEPSEACIAALQHIMDFVDNKKILGTRILWGLEILKIEWLSRPSSAETSLLLTSAEASLLILQREKQSCLRYLFILLYES